MRRTAVVFVVTAAVAQALGAQSAPTLDLLLDRMGAYLIEYESQLSSVVADETFDQTSHARHETRRSADIESVTRPTLVREPSGVNLVSSGRIWVEAATGKIWRAKWFYQEEKRRHDAWAPPRLRVDFEPHRDLGFMVPVRMTEVFSVEEARGEGKATYRNFRRFGTSARIVPQ